MGLLETNWMTPTKVRQISVLGERGMLVVDYLTQDLTLYEHPTRATEWDALAGIRGGGEGDMIRFALDRREPLRVQWEQFLAAVRDGRPGAGQRRRRARRALDARARSARRPRATRPSCPAYRMAPMPSVDELIGARRQRALVLGGAGFIGSHLVDGLVAAGAERVAVRRRPQPRPAREPRDALAHPPVTLEVGDACDEAPLRALVERDGPYDLCFNLAVIPLPHSLEHPRENVDRNVAMTTATCEVGRDGGFGRLVQFSSSEVYGTARTAPMDEDHPLGAHTPYAAAKAATDLVALSYHVTFGLDTVIVRPFNAYGERQNATAYAGLIPVVVRRCWRASRSSINGDGEQTRDMTHVADTVRGTLALAASAS